AQGRDGAIVNFLDTRVVAYDREHVAYHLSKRMLFSLTRMMALEFAPAVRVNAVAPGLILPPPGRDRAYLERLKSSNPLNRVGTLGQVTEAVLFLLGNEFVTGQVVFVDGGQHMNGRTYG
ncbi:MAG: SDR family oxidoreductase, partial [Planctomycetota bacterium]